MKKYILTICTLLWSINLIGQNDSHIKVVDEFLKIGDIEIGFVRTLKQEENLVFSTLDYLDRAAKKIKTSTYRDYGYSINPDTDEKMASTVLITDTIMVKENFGEISKSRIINNLSNLVYWIDHTGNQIPISDFEILIFSSDKFLPFNSCALEKNGEFDFEMMSLDVGDYIVIRELRTDPQNYVIGLDRINGYWRIK